MAFPYNLSKRQHLLDMIGTGTAGGSTGASSGSGSAPKHCGYPRRNGLPSQLGANEVNMGIQGTSSQDESFSGYSFCPYTHYHALRERDGLVSL